MRALHLGPCRVDRRQLQVGVGGEWPPPGSLGTRRDAALLHALDPRETVASHQAGILAVRPEPDVRAVAIREDVEDRAEIQVHSQSAQLTSFEHALAVRERFFARRPHREVVGKDRRPLAEHHDAAALVIGGDEQAAVERGLEIFQELRVLLGRFEVSPVQNEPGRARLTEEFDVGIRELRAGETEHQPLADEAFEVDHRTIIGWHPRTARDLRCTRTVMRLTQSSPRCDRSHARKCDKS